MASFRCGNQGLHWPWLSELMGRQLAFFLIKGGGSLGDRRDPPSRDEGRLRPAVAQEEKLGHLEQEEGFRSMASRSCISPRPLTQPSRPLERDFGEGLFREGSGEGGDGRMPAFSLGFLNN